MAKKKSPTKKFTKVLEQVKNDEGEIINIKETKIEVEIEKEEEPIFEEISKRTKLKNLKSTLLTRLREVGQRGLWTRDTSGESRWKGGHSEIS